MLKLNKKFNKMQFNEVIDIKKENFMFTYNLKNNIKNINDYIFIFIEDIYSDKYFNKNYKILNDKEIDASYKYKIFKKSKIIIYTFNFDEE